VHTNQKESVLRTGQPFLLDASLLGLTKHQVEMVSKKSDLQLKLPDRRTDFAKKSNKIL
jgi:hypothetical protein